MRTVRKAGFKTLKVVRFGRYVVWYVVTIIEVLAVLNDFYILLDKFSVVFGLEHGMLLEILCIEAELTYTGMHVP